MKRTGLFRLVVLVVGTAALGACADLEEQGLTPPDERQFSEAGQAAIRSWAEEKVNLQSLERVFAEISERSPAFAGMYYDKVGRLVVSLTNPAERAPATAAVASVANGYYMRAPGGGTRSIEVNAARFTFRDLVRWRNAAARVLSFGPVTGLDLDEKANKVAIYVREESHRAAAINEMMSLGIPREALAVEIRPPVETLQTLDDNVRPVRGGLAINAENCTFGFNATRQGRNGFVTASHCTNVQGGTEGTNFYQNDITSSRLIGEEQNDPEYFTRWPCPNGAICRYSDAAFVRFTGNVNFAFGKIANIVNGLTIHSTTPNVTIVADRRDIPAPVVGTFARKVGQTTGVTWGAVSQTCENALQDSGFTILCSFSIEAQDYDNSPIPMVGPGDSGSPTYSHIYGKIGQVQLWGVVWGGSVDRTEFWYSPIYWIIRDLGAMTTF